MSGHRNRCDFSGGVKTTLIFVWDIEFDLVLVLVSKLIVLVRGVEIECAGRNGLVSSVID